MQNEKTKKIKWVHKVLLVVAVCLIALGILIAKNSQNDYTTLRVGEQTLKVQIAKTSQKKKAGLCCRDSLPFNQGMLFVYDQPGYYSFWMKDTRIPLDMIWIDSSKQIVHIEHSVAPETYPKTFINPEPAQYILETNAGYAKKYNIKKSDEVAFSLSAIDSLKLLLP